MPKSLKNNKHQLTNTEFSEQARLPDEPSNWVFAQSKICVHLMGQAFSTGDSIPREHFSHSSSSCTANTRAPKRSFFSAQVY